LPVSIEEHDPSIWNLGGESADTRELARFDKACDKVDDPRAAKAPGAFIVNGSQFEAWEPGPPAGIVAEEYAASLGAGIACGGVVRQVLALIRFI
jgi:hypothetical protein